MIGKFLRQVCISMNTGINIKLSGTILFILFNVLTVHSAQNEISFDFFPQGNGLPDNQIQFIYQDARGWMWFGTNQGLSRFDGYRFKNLINNPDDSTSLQGNIARFIFEDRNGTLLVGTEKGGLNLLAKSKQVFHNYSALPDDNHFFNSSVEIYKTYTF